MKVTAAQLESMRRIDIAAVDKDTLVDVSWTVILHSPVFASRQSVPRLGLSKASLLSRPDRGII